VYHLKDEETGDIIKRIPVERSNDCLHMWEMVAQNGFGRQGTQTFWCPFCGSLKREYRCDKEGKLKKCEVIAPGRKTNE